MSKESKPGPKPESREFMFTRRMLYSLWWLGALILILSVLFLLRILVPAIEYRNKFKGDGKNPGTYGFDLSNLLVPRENLVAADVSKDEIPALVNPKNVQGADVLEINKERKRREHMKFLVSTDRVIGVSIGGESRAYPLRILAWHEVANDTLGGALITVTYSPLCDSAAVFRRDVEGETLEFGVSGLLYNSNLVMYDRRAAPASASASRESSNDTAWDGGAAASAKSIDTAESLWSQLGARAIAGPAASMRAPLSPLPCAVMQWGDWLKEHPDTTVITGDPNSKEKYNSSPYAVYFAKGEPRFPYSPAPPEGIPLMERVLVVTAGGYTTGGGEINVRGDTAMLYLSDIAKGADEDGTFTLELAGRSIRIIYRPAADNIEPETAYVLPEDMAKIDSAIYSFWFAWYAVWKGAK